MTTNLEELAAILQAPPADLLNQFDFLNDLPAGRSLEGYIPPETVEYEMSGANAAPFEVAERLLDRSSGPALTPEIREAITAQGLTIDQAVIIASIVEREAVIDEERPLHRRRLHQALPGARQRQTAGLLNADPTLQYGLTTGELRPEGHPLLANTEGSFLPVDEWGTVEWWPQLQVGGGDVALEEYLLGFQTYTQTGLPPMPIAAPRIESIAAVANAPLDDGFLFFVAGCPDGTRDGSHYFAATLAEHNANIARANEECAGL